ncbi:MAG TPA: hypothetical protein VJC21_06160 [Candidatus Nanoarchaeia archaeon]|nr:hypothetical protein [Candidatus Nanoarchaeia archaeon]
MAELSEILEKYLQNLDTETQRAKDYETAVKPHFPDLRVLKNAGQRAEKFLADYYGIKHNKWEAKRTAEEELSDRMDDQNRGTVGTVADAAVMGFSYQKLTEIINVSDEQLPIEVKILLDYWDDNYSSWTVEAFEMLRQGNPNEKRAASALCLVARNRNFQGRCNSQCSKILELDRKAAMKP